MQELIRLPATNYYEPLDGNDVSVTGGTGLWSATGTALLPMRASTTHG